MGATTLAASNNNNNNTNSQYQQHIRFDTDSYRILVDSGTSYCMTPCMQDFIGSPQPCNKNIAGLGQQTATYYGTIRWKWEDDSRQTFAFDIPNSLYVRGLKYRMLSPQHWAQSYNNEPWVITKGDNMSLHWNAGNNIKTMQLDPRSNIGVCWSAPSYKDYIAFIAEHQFKNPFQGLTCFPAEVSDDEAEENEDEDTQDNSSDFGDTVDHSTLHDTPNNNNKPTELGKHPQPVEIQFQDDEIDLDKLQQVHPE